MRIKGCLEGGHKKKGANDGVNDGSNDGSTAPTNSEGKKMIRGPVTCKKCGEKGHRQASYKCPLNGTKKRQVFFLSIYQSLNYHLMVKYIFI